MPPRVVSAGGTAILGIGLEVGGHLLGRPGGVAVDHQRSEAGDVRCRLARAAEFLSSLGRCTIDTRDIGFGAIVGSGPPAAVWADAVG